MVWKKAREEFERQLDEMCRHNGANADMRKMGYLQSCDPSLLRAMCENVWSEELDENGLKKKIDEILNTPSHSFGITEADLEDYCHALRMPAQGSVASRLGQFMMQVNDVIDRHALRADLHVKGSLKMFFEGGGLST